MDSIVIVLKCIQESTNWLFNWCQLSAPIHEETATALSDKADSLEADSVLIDVNNA